jgi:hypothetical protein
MFCSDFIFADKWLSDLGLMICNFDGSTATKSGGDVTFITSKPPGTDRYSFYGSQQETPITMTFSIGKNPCMFVEEDNLYFTQEEQSFIYRWLVRRDGYHWLGFDEEGFEDVWFNSQINLQEIFVAGQVAGYDVTVTTDSPYAYSQEHEKEFTLAASETHTLKNYSDIPGDIFPRVIINPKASGDIILETGCTGYKKTTKVSQVVSSDTIILDGKDDYYSGVKHADLFNYVFPVMGNSFDDINTCFTNTGDISLDIKIIYRFVRRCAI